MDHSATSAYSGMALKDIFADLASRFIVNLPAEELESIERICFQVEQSHWFYDDFIRPLRPDLPAYTLRRFSEAFLTSCSPHLSAFSFDPKTAYDAFAKYKASVPVRGAILLNTTWDKVLLVKGWKSGSGWGFPKGKINQNESDRDCAVREVWEEVGYDVSPHFDSTRRPHPQQSHSAPPPLKEDQEEDEREDWVEVVSHGQLVRLYIVPGVSEDTIFETRTRKEISQIAWKSISDLPSHKTASKDSTSGQKYYMVQPIVRALKNWIAQHKHPKKASKAQARYEILQNPTLNHAEVKPKPVFADVEEGNNALQALFFGDTYGSTLPSSSHPTTSLAPLLSLLPAIAVSEPLNNRIADPSPVSNPLESRTDELLRLLMQDSLHAQQQQQQQDASIVPPSQVDLHRSPSILSSASQSSVSPISSASSPIVLNEVEREARRKALLANLDFITGLSSPPNRYQPPPMPQYRHQQYNHQQHPSTGKQNAHRLLNILQPPSMLNQAIPPMHNAAHSLQRHQRQDSGTSASLALNAKPANVFGFNGFENMQGNHHYAQPPHYSHQPPSNPYPNQMQPMSFSQPMPIRPIPLLQNFSSPPPKQPDFSAPPAPLLLPIPPPVNAPLTTYKQRANLLNLFNAPMSSQALDMPSPHPNYPSGSPERR